MIVDRFPPAPGNHNGIASAVGYTDVRQYRYYKKETKGLDFEGMIQDIKVIQFCDSLRECHVLAS